MSHLKSLYRMQSMKICEYEKYVEAIKNPIDSEEVRNANLLSLVRIRKEMTELDRRIEDETDEYNRAVTRFYELSDGFFGNIGYRTRTVETSGS